MLTRETDRIQTFTSRICKKHQESLTLPEAVFISNLDLEFNVDAVLKHKMLHYLPWNRSS